MSNQSKLFNKNFLLLWQGQFISQLGSQAFAIAMLFWTKHQTDSGALVGTLLMLSILPQVLLSPLAGTFADFHSRKKIIVACDLINAFFMIWLASAFFLFPQAHALLFGSVLVVSSVNSSVKAFFNPAVIAALPELVSLKNVAAATSSLQILVQVASLLGQGLGGILFRLLGAPLLFLINGLSYLFSGFLSFFITIPPVPAENGEAKRTIASFKKDTIIGFRYILENRGLRATFYIFALLNFFVSPILVILPFYVEDVLKVATDWYGYIAGVFGAGSVIGYLIVGVLKLKGTIRRNSMVFAFMSSALLVFVLSTISIPWLALVLFALLGIFNGFINVNILVQIQTSIKSELRGRILGNLMTLTGGVVPISLAITGIVIDLVNKKIQLMLMGCGCTLLLLSVIILLNKNFLEFLASAPAISPEDKQEDKVSEEKKILIEERIT